MELDGLPSTVTPRPAATLTFDLLIPKSNQHIYKRRYICDQNLVKFPILVFEIWCLQGFCDAQTRALTNGHTRIQNASSTVFQQWPKHKYCSVATQQNATFLGLCSPVGHYDPKFKLGRDFCTMHLSPKFHHPTFTRSEVIVLTNTQTHPQRNKQIAAKTSHVLLLTTTLGNKAAC